MSKRMWGVKRFLSHQRGNYISRSTVVLILEGETEMDNSSQGRCLILGSVLKFWNIVCKYASVLSNVQISEISLGHFKMVRIITFDLR